MQTNLPPQPEGPPAVRIFGVGDTGLSVIEQMIGDGLPPELFVAVNTERAALDASSAGQKICLQNRLLRGLGSGSDPRRGRQAAEDQSEQLKPLCENVPMVFIVTGLGGGSGTGISPVLAGVAKAAGARVLAFVTTPFECEGDHRQCIAETGLEELRNTADGVICLPNQKIFKLIEENTSVVDTFRITNRFLADGVHGLWRLVAFKGLIQVHPVDVIDLLQDRHCECAFAVAQAAGPERARQVVDKLFGHPMLDAGAAFTDAESVLVSLMGGSNLTMAEINSVTEQIKAKCDSAQVLVGAGVNESFQDRLAVTVITARKPDLELAPRGQPESLNSQLLDRSATAKPGSRFLPPPPALLPEQMQEMLARQKTGRSAPRRTSLKMRQAQLPLEIISKGRFDKSEPTIHKGEDLDVPTYIRRGVPLN